MSLSDLICCIFFVVHFGFAGFLVVKCILFCKELKKGE